jgi:uncharacterized cupredoxin-like copper-binding protein
MYFQIQHVTTLSKYAGISFIAGAVNHGMFSEQRSLVTAGLGVLFFLIGAYVENRSQGGEAVSWGDVLGFGILSSIGLGFFTGGLQHFPDTPQRSAWVVPLGFFLSLISLYFGKANARASAKAVLLYALGGGALVVVACVAALGLFNDAPPHEHEHGDSAANRHMEEAAPTPTSQVGEADALRTVVINMDDSLRFAPAHWEAKEGEALRLVVINSGTVRHELVIGQEKELAEHAQLMRGAPHGHHHMDNAVSVEPGQAALLPWSFKTPGTWGMACFEPGHFEAGMVGKITVTPQHSH